MSKEGEGVYVNYSMCHFQGRKYERHLTKPLRGHTAQTNVQETVVRQTTPSPAQGTRCFTTSPRAAFLLPAQASPSPIWTSQLLGL